MRIVGILLAAGAASRFGGAKLLAALPDGAPVGVRAASNLVAVVPETLAVVRPGDDALAAALGAAGVRVTLCPDAHTGMGASLAHGVREAGAADGYVIALADMPYIARDTIAQVATALRGGAAIVVPRHAQRRGHPVGFGAAHREALMRLSGDTGARALLAGDDVQWLDVDDPGMLKDIDTPADLPRD